MIDVANKIDGKSTEDLEHGKAIASRGGGEQATGASSTCLIKEELDRLAVMGTGGGKAKLLHDGSNMPWTRLARVYAGWGSMDAMEATACEKASPFQQNGCPASR